VQVDGFYYWHCDVCRQSVPESPWEDDARGYGNLLVLELGQGPGMVCRDCVCELGVDARCRGLGFVLAGTWHTGARAREWANEVIAALLDNSCWMPEEGCGTWVLALEEGVETGDSARSLVALVKAARAACGNCPLEPGDCPVNWWARELKVAHACRKEEKVK
jgi:hypothetical protein